MPLVIAACTNRKRPSATVRAGALARGSVDAVGHAWLELLANETTYRAAGLYCGRSAREAERTAALLEAPLLFASAGLGWIAADQSVPSYGATIMDGEDNILAKLDDDSDARGWWRWINRHSPFATSFEQAVQETAGVILVALPGAYLAMIEPDLLALAPDQLKRLRIIERLPTRRAALQDLTLPYDARLDAPASGFAGTRSDFYARAARHFAQVIHPAHPGADLQTHAEAVGAELSRHAAPDARVGKRQSDQELRAIVATHWDRAAGRTTRLLRILRDDLGIACEQGRFARLMQAMRAEREKTA
jgi:hypothetical protein